jgi:hypothetical protein
LRRDCSAAWVGSKIRHPRIKLKAKLTPKAYDLGLNVTEKRETNLGIANPEDVVTMATGQVLATHALRDDLMAVLFPRSGGLPSELLQSRVKLKLQALTSGMERALLNTKQERLQSWDLLSESGLLREPALIDFALSRIAEDKLRHNIQSAPNSSILGQLTVTLLAHDNDRLSEMARSLLHAEQISASDDSQLFQRLDNETLHLLCWRIVAALLECKAAENEVLSLAAQTLLSTHDNDLNPCAIARKLVFFLGQEHRDILKNPRTAGLHLFIASFDQDYGLGSDFLLRLIGGDHVTPLLLLLKGQSVPAAEAVEILAALRGNDARNDVPEWGSVYALLDPVEARAAIASWKPGIAQ